MPLLPVTAPGGVTSIAYRCPACCDCAAPVLISDYSSSSVSKCGFSYEGEDTVYLTSTGPSVLGGTPDVTTYDPFTCVPTTTTGTEGCSAGWGHEGTLYLRRTTTWVYDCDITILFDPILFPNAPAPKVNQHCVSSGTITKAEEYFGLIYNPPPEGFVFPDGYDDEDLCKLYTSISGSVDSTSIQYNLSSSGITPETTNDRLCTRQTLTSDVTITESGSYGADGTKDPQETNVQTNEFFAYAFCNGGTDAVLSSTTTTFGPSDLDLSAPNVKTLCGYSGCFVETITYDSPYTPDPGGYSNEFTFEILEEKLDMNFTGFTGTLLPGTGNSVIRYLSPDGASLTESRLKYAFIFQPPPSRAYRVRWIARTLATAGAALTALDVWAPGCYRPHAWAPAYGGSPTDPTIGFQLTAIMGTDGSVVGIEAASAFPFAAAPFAVEVEAPVIGSGGTRSTGWVGTVGADRTVTFARVGGSGGNYLPDLDVASGGAAGTLVMDPRGGIASVNLTTTGAGYVEPPSNLFYAEPKVSVLVAHAVFAARLGSEVEHCATWNGVIPGDYDPEDQSTWPQVPSTPLDLLPGDGTDTQVVIVNIRADCTGDTCA